MQRCLERTWQTWVNISTRCEWDEGILTGLKICLVNDSCQELQVALNYWTLLIGSTTDKGGKIKNKKTSQYLMHLETQRGLAPEESLINSPSPDECALESIRYDLEVIINISFVQMWSYITFYFCILLCIYYFRLSNWDQVSSDYYYYKHNNSSGY